MADEPVRSLLAELGFNFDPTGADRFKSTFNEIKLTLKDAQIDASSIDFTKFFQGMEKNFKKNAKTSEKSLKLQIFTMGARVAGFMKRAAVDVFTSFATLDEAQASLRFKIGNEGLERVQKTIKELPKDVRDLTTDLDLFNAVIDSVSKAGDLDFILNNLGTSAKLGLASRTGTKEVLGTISSFIQSGGGGQRLADVGVFTPSQLEQFKKTKTFEQLSQSTPRARQGFIQPFIDARQSSAQEFITGSSKSASGLLKKSESTAEDIKTFFGEKLLVPALSGFFDFTGALKEQNKKTERRASELQGKTVNVKNDIVIKTDATDPIRVGQEVKKVLAQTWGSVVEDSELRTPPQSANTIVPPSTP